MTFMGKISLSNTKSIGALSLTISVLLIASSIFINSSTNGQTHVNKKGAFVDQVNFIHYLNESQSLQALKAGKIDTYFFEMPPALVSQVKNDPRLNLYETSPANLIDLLLNPAPAKNQTLGQFSPFSIRQVRFAMNYLIDRDLLVKVYGGVPAIDPYGVYFPEYLNIIDTVQSFGFRHDPILAEKMISGALTHVGAIKNSSNGTWIYNGKPITIRILIRVDIPYLKSAGEAVASNLQKIGFNVVRDYGDRKKVNSIVYGSDPQDLKWNVLAESSTPSFIKYDPFTVAGKYAPWDGNMPGEQNPSYWNYKNATLDAVTKKLALGNFTTENERNNLLKTAVKDGIQESVRVNIAHIISPYIATKNVKGLINDFGSGITSGFSLINSRLGDNRTTINVGTKQIYVGAWNNIEGCADIYCSEIMNEIRDSPTTNHPYTGEVIPVRTPWTDIQTKGPLGKFTVPSDAIVWDPVKQNWKNESGINATTAFSKITYDLLYSKWHNGVMMDKNDVLYNLYFASQWGTNTGPSDKKVDSSYTPAQGPAIKQIKGIRFLSDNKVEVYINFWHFDKNEIAGAPTNTWVSSDSSAVWPGEPWEITAAEERLVTAGKFAFSNSDSSSKHVEWLSLILPSHANAIKEELQKMMAEGYVPAALRGTVTVNEADKRYNASINWITQHNNAIIGNGPFYLDSYNPSAGVITIKAFRDNSYPFNLGYWSKYEHPKLATIENVNQIPTIFHIGVPTNIIVQVDVDGKPNNNATVHYYLSNNNGTILANGTAKPLSLTNATAVGKFTIALNSSDTSKLHTGPNVLQLFATSFDAYKPYIVSRNITAVKDA
jgi:peptide/nickel transport system substrate-binding protein